MFRRKKKNHTVANRSFVDNQVWQNVAANNQTTVKLVSFVARTHENVREKELGQSIASNTRMLRSRILYIQYKDLESKNHVPKLSQVFASRMMALQKGCKQNRIIQNLL